MEGPAALAAEAIRMVGGDTRAARRLAQTALDAALPAGDLRAGSMAERALGLVAREAGDVVASASHLRRAIRIAESGGLDVCAGEARMSLLGTLVVQGDWRGALREADRAAGALKGLPLARLRVQRATVLYDQGRLEEALDGYRRALPVLRRNGDSLWLARLLHNRGMVHWQRGALAAAEADFAKARKMYGQLGQHRSVASIVGNLGLVAMLRGDLPAALASFDEADAWLRGQGVTDAMLLARSAALLDARLVAEARALAETAVNLLTGEHRGGYLAKARLRLAEAALAGGDLATAAGEAALARRAFARQHRPAWAALARYVALRAAWLGPERSAALVREALTTARELAAAGFAIPALDAEILGAEVAIGLGRRELGRGALARARRGRSSGPAQLRSRAWHAEALLRLADGNRRGAEAALQAGMRVLERYRAALGATELRAHASGHAAQLAELGTRLAIEDRRALRVLAWAERSRAGALRLRPARPPDDARLAGDLARLRGLVVDLEAAALAGRPTDRLLARQAELEEAVRSRARHAKGILAAAIEPPPPAAEVVEGLGDHALVEIVNDRGDLHAVVVAGGTARLRRLAAVADVARELDGLRFAFKRLSAGRGTPSSLAAARGAADFGAGRLDEMLLAPLGPEIGDRPLLIVPTSLLHAVPWAALPSCHGRAVTTAPSAAVWLRASRPTPPVDGAVVFVAGPRLPHAAREVADLARRYPGARRLTGGRATCEAVCASLDGASLAHVASHGRFRADNPLFSCLELADGPLTVYDLECLDGPPRTLVLSSCDSGLSDVRPGDELMGLAAAVLALGTTTLVASVFPVADEATRLLMLAFHAQLRAGRPVATALAAAQAESRYGEPQAFAASAGFACFGAGHRPVA